MIPVSWKLFADTDEFVLASVVGRNLYADRAGLDSGLTIGIGTETPICPSVANEDNSDWPMRDCPIPYANGVNSLFFNETFSSAPSLANSSPSKRP
ncbi:unnamed protein product [Hydatigera taeniaeformis]|uniref:TonB_dep_Rec domain-containing protein n=1 Tax=Hydatigena taeniaeformis TaxID=6205 RepID=A0A0R3X889_HYDTA|nr:unnamed protein product [Hydatigera taeniaeformis]